MWSLASPLALFVGGGASFVDVSDDGFDVAPALHVSLGYQAEPQLALGVHSRLSRVSGTAPAGDSEYFITWDYTLWTLDVGAAVELTYDRARVQPWLGVHLTRGDSLIGVATDMGESYSREDRPTPLLAAGILVSVDLTTAEPHHLAWFLAAQLSTSYDHDYFESHYNALTLGLAYRY